MKQHGYMSYVRLTTNGALKVANLKMLFERARDYENASFKGLYNFIHYIERMKKIGQDFGSAKIIGENENVVRIMSIHKSKGLEFPVVFLCGMGKNFNFRDLNEKILLHQDIGFGPKYINYSRQIEYDTLAKEAIKVMSKQEEVSEEMRVLYVGLTRAKEKLILIGVQKDAQKEIEEKTEMISSHDESKLPAELVKKYRTYLDWLELVYIKNDLEIAIHAQNDLSKDIQKIVETEETVKQDSITKEEKEELSKIINWKYPNSELSVIPSKSSVTAIKKLVNKEKEFTIAGCTLEMPEFLQEEKALTGAQKGTIMHSVLQRLDLRKTYTEQEIIDFINELVAKKILTQKEQESINVAKIVEFLKSDLASDIREAKQIYKEKPFFLYIPAKYIYGGNTKEKIVVQGIIDLYYEDKNGELVLVDYKTDYVQDENELIEKYSEQLQIYQNAIEQATGQKIARKFIYSLKLGKEILVRLL